MFDNVTQDKIYTKVDALDPKKACMEKALIGTNDSISGYFPEIYNHSKCFNKYPNSLKTADVTPIHKEKEKTFKNNYRPESILPVPERMNKSLSTWKNTYLLIYLAIGRDMEHNIVCWSWLKCGGKHLMNKK